MSLIGQILTVFGVIVGAIWIGIGVNAGGDIYKFLLQKRFVKWLKHFYKIKKKVSYELEHTIRR